MNRQQKQTLLHALIGLTSVGPLVQDSMHFTEHGRRLLVSLGVLDPDPLRVAAERWLSEHTGPKTPATKAVRRALGPPTPPQLLEAAERFRTCPWKEKR